MTAVDQARAAHYRAEAVRHGSIAADWMNCPFPSKPGDVEQLAYRGAREAGHYALMVQQLEDGQ